MPVADREEYFRNAIQQAWEELEASRQDAQRYAAAFWRYCRLLCESSDYARAQLLPASNLRHP